MSNSNTYFKLCAFLLKVEVFFLPEKRIFFVKNFNTDTGREWVLGSLQVQRISKHLRIWLVNLKNN